MYDNRTGKESGRNIRHRRMINKSLIMQKAITAFKKKKKSRLQELCTFRRHVKFLLYFSQAAKPINATGDYIKSHSKTLKYIVLGLLGAGNTSHIHKLVSVSPPAYLVYDPDTFVEDTLTLVSCRLCGVLYCSLCAGFPEGHCTCGPHVCGCCRRDLGGWK